jgi:23S rRNA (uracil1939-C5)-methyltransferase
VKAKTKIPQYAEVVIEKLVHGGQGLGVLTDGRKVFVWNALPGEKVKALLTKMRRDYAEGVAEEILQASPDRTEPVDEAYLSTSPWQIMSFEKENEYKLTILEETFQRAGIVLNDVQVSFTSELGRAAGDADSFRAPRDEKPETGVSYGYRNKMEYSFWADDDGVHLALFNRGTHGKRIVAGSSIARPEVDEAANKMCSILNEHNIRGSQLKTVVVRCNQAGETVIALFVKDESFPKIPELASVAKGVGVYYSNPKSPASIITKKRYQYGDVSLEDRILETTIKYDVNSFFQVNLPVFELAIKQIQVLTAEAQNKIDMYSGVGTIGIPIGDTKTLVEIDPHNVVMAKQNVGKQPIEVVQASSEQALDFITTDSTIIVDPPRAGLHQKVVDRMLEVKPLAIAYLSCNPVTQARDLKYLQESYTVQTVTGYNFFPRTPHIESLTYLVRK